MESSSISGIKVHANFPNYSQTSCWNRKKSSDLLLGMQWWWYGRGGERRSPGTRHSMCLCMFMGVWIWVCVRGTLGRVLSTLPLHLVGNSQFSLWETISPPIPCNPSVMVPCTFHHKCERVAQDVHTQSSISPGHRAIFRNRHLNWTNQNLSIRFDLWVSPFPGVLSCNDHASYGYWPSILITWKKLLIECSQCVEGGRERQTDREMDGW